MDPDDPSLLVWTCALPSAHHGFLLRLMVYHLQWLYRQVHWHSPGLFDDPGQFIHPFEFLVDLYWENQPVLESVITRLTAPQPLYPISQQGYSENFTLIRKFLFPFDAIPDSALPSDAIYLENINTARLGIIDDEELEGYTQRLIPSPTETPTFEMEAPYSADLRKWNLYKSGLRGRLDKLLRATGEMIQIFLERNRDQPRPAQAFNSISGIDLASTIAGVTGRSPDVHTLVLFAVSGSGKTRSIERLLSQHYGFYFQSCYVPSQPSGINGAQRVSGSKDTLSLGKMIQHATAFARHLGSKNESNLIRTWLRCLIHYRQLVFVLFLDLTMSLRPQIDQRILPRLWFELQLSSEVDLFDEGFQLLCLTESPLLYGAEAINSFRQSFTGSHVYFCLDEAQADLDIQLRAGDTTVNLLQLWANALYDAQFMDKVEQAPTVFSGTSLRMDDAIKAVDLTASLQHGSNPHPDCAIFSDFPLVQNHLDFREIMNSLEQKIPIIGNTEIIILSQAHRFYGRPAWSVRYLDAVKAEILRSTLPYSDFSMSQIVGEAADDAEAEIKQDLKGRLHQLNSSGSDRLTDDMCRVVVWSDILDQPTPFYDETGPVMIERAFGTCRSVNGRLKYFLAEKMALDAGKEFFMNERPELIEKFWGRFLQDHAGQMADLGKGAEAFLAWNLVRAFRTDDDRLPGSEEVNRRERLLASLASARPLGSHPPLDLSGHALLLGSTTGHVYDGSVQLSTWIDSVRSVILGSQLTATVFFPENNTGPDLIFALHRSSASTKDIILCLLQLKCGEVKKAIQSTDMSKAYHE